jgi:glutamate synthase domain-containing protein 1
VSLALEALRNLEHRGAIGSDAGTGDGAGILTQMPDAFLRAVVDFDLPPGRRVRRGPGVPAADEERAAVKAGVEQIAAAEGLTVLGWREVPTERSTSASSPRRAPHSSSCSSRAPPSATRPRSRASTSTAASTGCASAPAASTTPTSCR